MQGALTEFTASCNCVSRSAMLPRTYRRQRAPLGNLWRVWANHRAPFLGAWPMRHAAGEGRGFVRTLMWAVPGRAGPRPRCSETAQGIAAYSRPAVHVALRPLRGWLLPPVLCVCSVRGRYWLACNLFCLCAVLVCLFGFFFPHYLEYLLSSTSTSQADHQTYIHGKPFTQRLPRNQSG